MSSHHQVIVVSIIGLLLTARANGASGAPPGASPRPVIAVHARAPAAGPAAYTIRDVGAPPITTYPSSSPIGFNNSGQIFGAALRAAKGDRASYGHDTDCLLWTGARFVDLESSLNVQECTPYAIDSAGSSSGAYGVVGAFTDIHHIERGYSSAFYASVAASGAFTVAPYYDHSPAGLYGINANGTAAGYSYNNVNDFAIFVTAQQQLTFLQPSCATSGTGCLATVDLLKTQSNGEPQRTCAFGGCTINASGKVLGFDPIASVYALATVGSAGPPLDLPLPIAQGNFGYVVALNDADQIVYFTIGSTSATFIYNVDSATTTSIPPVAGTSCAHYYPISLNNRGAVLGFASFCKQKPFYFIWDPVNGTRNLNLLLPASGYTIAPLGINDNGQILASLVTSTATTHWGTLDPVSATVKARAVGEKPHHAR